MSVWPTFVFPPPTTITPYSFCSIGRDLNLYGGGQASAAWPSANRAYFVPFVTNQTTTIMQLFIVNGSTASGNFDIGIYDDNGTKIVSSGSTAQSGTSVIQAVDITDTMIGAGRYYLALSMNGTTGTNQSFSTAAAQNQAMGTFLAASAFALPATVTLAQNTTAFIPNFGLSTVPII